MPTRQSTHIVALDDITVSALETQDGIVAIYREADAIERSARTIKRLCQTTIASNAAITSPVDRLRALTLVAPRGRAHGSAA